MEEQTPEKTKEIEIQGDSLEKFYPIVTMVANELRFRNNFYEARLATSNVTDSYAGFAVFIIEQSAHIKTLIGAFTLLLLGSNRIHLRVSPRSRWHHDFDLTPAEIIKLGLIKKDETDRKFNDEQFNQFIKSLEDRLAHYRIKVTRGNRVWQWIDTHRILSILAAFAAIATIFGVIYTVFN